MTELMLGDTLPVNIWIRKEVNIYSKYKFVRVQKKNKRILDFIRQEIYTLQDLNEIINN